MTTEPDEKAYDEVTHIEKRHFERRHNTLADLRGLPKET